MCVIVVSPKGTGIEKANIETACQRNKDGWGIMAMYAKGTYVHPKHGGHYATEKGFSVERAWKVWKQHKNALWRVFHARTGTSGLVNLSNCHPFDASSATGKRALFHNGVIRGIPELNPDYCDSWHLAQYLRKFDTNKEFLQKLGDYAEYANSRFAFVDVETETVWRMGRGWVEKEGVFFSNAMAFPFHGTLPVAAVALLGGYGCQKDSAGAYDACNTSRLPRIVHGHWPGSQYTWCFKEDAWVLREFAVTRQQWEKEKENARKRNWGMSGTSTGSHGVSHGTFDAGAGEPRRFVKGCYPPIIPGLSYRWCSELGYWWERDSSKGFSKSLVMGPHPNTILLSGTPRFVRMERFRAAVCVRTRRILGYLPDPTVLQNHYGTSYAYETPETGGVAKLKWDSIYPSQCSGADDGGTASAVLPGLISSADGHVPQTSHTEAEVTEGRALQDSTGTAICLPDGMSVADWESREAKRVAAESGGTYKKPLSARDFDNFDDELEAQEAAQAADADFKRFIEEGNGVITGEKLG